MATIKIPASSLWINDANGYVAYDEVLPSGYKAVNIDTMLYKTGNGTALLSALSWSVAQVTGPQWWLVKTAIGNQPTTIFPAVELMPSYGYGHSALAATGQYRTTSASYWEKVVRRLNMGAYTNRALASYEWSNVTNGANSTGVAGLNWVPGTTGIVIADCGIADMFGSIGQTQKLDAMGNAIRHFLCQMGAASKINDNTTFVRTGTWTAPSNNIYASAGSRTVTAVNGSYSIIPFTGDKIDVTIYGTDEVAWTPGGSTFDITVEAGTTCPMLPLSGTTVNQGRVSTNIAAQTYTPMAIRLSGFGAGSHNIRVTNTGATGKFLVLDDAMIPSTTPPTVLVQKIAYCNSSYYAGTGGMVSDALIDTFNARIASVVAEFSYAYLIDTNPGLNVATMLGADGAHKNDFGESHRADVVVNYIQQNLAFRNGQNALTTP